MVKKDNRKKRIVKFFGILFAVILIVDLTPLGGNSIMYTNAVRCGRLPLQSEATYTGQSPHYVSTTAFDIFRGYPKYFCSPEEAERAGFSASADDRVFPHLPPEEQRDAIEKSWDVNR